MTRGEWKESLLRAFFPRRCAYCGKVIGKNDRACRECLPVLPVMQPPYCPFCGVTRSLCTCRGHRRAFDGCISAMRYESGARRAILRLKEHREKDIVDAMAEEMAQSFRERAGALPVDVVTFVPMDGESQRRREYNQGELLAGSVAEKLSLPCWPILRKLYATSSQKDLPRLQRSGNLLGAFDVLSPDISLVGFSVLLVDDVLTTGATLHECAKVLKIYGASRVTALVFAAVARKEPEET